MASRDKVDMDTFHKSIQYALERLGKSKSGFQRTAVSNFNSKKHEGSGNELVDYSRAPCLGADQKARGLWERDWMIIAIMTSRRKKRANAQNFRKWRRRLLLKQRFEADFSDHSSFKWYCIQISSSNYHCFFLRGK